jgi:hypothetical protein
LSLLDRQHEEIGIPPQGRLRIPSHPTGGAQQ